MYGKVSLPKKSGTAGSPVPKSNTILILLKDLAKDASGNYTGYPERDSKGVKMEGAFVFTGTEKGIGIYLTPSTISRNDIAEGEPDAGGWTQNFSGAHPGDSLELNEFLQNNLLEDFIIVSTECSETEGTRVHGTPCNPMKMLPEGQDNNEGKKYTLNFKQEMRSKFKSAHYYGAMPAISDATAEAPEESSEESGL